MGEVSFFGWTIPLIGTLLDPPLWTGENGEGWTRWLHCKPIAIISTGDKKITRFTNMCVRDIHLTVSHTAPLNLGQQQEFRSHTCAGKLREAFMWTTMSLSYEFTNQFAAFSDPPHDLKSVDTVHVIAQWRRSTAANTWQLDWERLKK